MSLITQCPACATLFRVVPDQLKISDGWVRCGQCAQVFDATESLRTADEPQGVPSTDPERHPDSLPAPQPEPEPEPDGKREPVLERGEVGERFGGAEDVAFVRQAHRRATWERPGVRFLLALLVVLLGLLLAGQLALQHPSWVARHLPQMRPLLDTLCQPPACRPGPSQRIEAITIDSSSFSRLQPDAYQLQLTLANKSDAAIAMPALELTLTDSQDQAVLRRVIQPADLGPGTPASIAPSGEWSSVLTFDVTPDAGAARITGYRLLAFYP